MTSQVLEYSQERRPDPGYLRHQHERREDFDHNLQAILKNIFGPNELGQRMTRFDNKILLKIW